MDILYIPEISKILAGQVLQDFAELLKPHCGPSVLAGQTPFTWADKYL